MKSPFRKRHSTPQTEKFSGVGTVLMGGIISVATLAEHLSHEDLIEVLKQLQNHVRSGIEKHSGTILQFAGDAVLAFWAPHVIAPGLSAAFGFSYLFDP